MSKCKAFVLSATIFLLALGAGISVIEGWTASYTLQADWSSAYARAREGLVLWLGSVWGASFVYVYLRVQSPKGKLKIARVAS